MSLLVADGVARERSNTAEAERGRWEDDRSGTDWLVAGGLVVTLSAVLAVLDTRLRHWYVIPVTLCGVLIGVDAWRWFRRRLDILDPLAMLGLLGFHLFYLAPLLHVLLDYWAPRIDPPADWREALGAMAVLNACGLCLYRLTGQLRTRPGARPQLAPKLDEYRFYWIGAVAVALGMMAFGAEIVVFGGVDGFIDVMTEGRGAFEGLSWLIILAEYFPVMAFALTVARWRVALAQRPGIVLLLIAGLTVLQFVVGGLRGSRSNTIWPVLLGLMLVHFLVIRISRKALLCFALAFAAFMHLYGLYKSAGVEVLEVARGNRTVGEVSAETGRGAASLLLGDLARADVQALVLDRQQTSDVELAYGRTYLGDAAFLVPRWLRPEGREDKVAVGTDVILGSGASDAGMRLTRIYGVTGEAMLNFGPLGVPVAFAILGLVVRFARRYYARALHGSDLVPKLLAPSLCLATVLLPSCDLDNTLVFLIRQFLPLALVVFVALRREPADPRVQGAIASKNLPIGLA